MKKVVAVLLTLVMVLGMSASVFAGGTDGSVKITNAKEGETYAIYKVFDLTYTKSGETTSVAYAYNGSNAAFLTALKAETSPFTVTENVGGGYNIARKDSANDEDIIAFIEKNAANFGDAVASKKAAEDGSLTFDNLAYGYYYITTTQGTLVTIDSTLKDVEVQDKTQTPPTPDKTAGEYEIVGAQIGDSVPFEAVITAKKGAENYVYHDTMSTGLVYGKDAKVFVRTTDGDGKNTDTELDSANYTVQTTGMKDTCTFEVKFKQEYLNTITADTKLVVKYTAVLTENVETTMVETNKAKLSWGDDQETTEDTVKIFSSKILIDKYDAADTTKATKLKDAEFILVKKTKGADDSTVESFYKYTAASGDDHAKVEWVSDIKDATTVITDEGGAAKFEGLADGTYYLRETNAPMGYNLLASDVEVKVAHDAENVQGVSVTSQIANSTGTELPSTGGIGTTIFYIVGSILLLGAAVMLVTKRRMNAE